MAHCSAQRSVYTWPSSVRTMSWPLFYSTDQFAWSRHHCSTSCFPPQCYNFAQVSDDHGLEALKPWIQINLTCLSVIVTVTEMHEVHAVISNEGKLSANMEPPTELKGMSFLPMLMWPLISWHPKILENLAAFLVTQLMKVTLVTMWKITATLFYIVTVDTK